MTSDQNEDHIPDAIEMPAPTYWPMILAFGITLLVAGLVTQVAVSVVGLLLLLLGAVGWFKEIFPMEKHELVPVLPESQRAQPIKVSSRSVARLQAGVASHRVRIPAQIHPYSSGIKGGLVGGIAMALVACLYGFIAHDSIWYPINLLAAVALPSMAMADLTQLKAFDGTSFIIALICHAAFSCLVGLLFAILLPMLPSRRAAFWGSFLSPILWSALVWATLGLINPTLNARINWIWFVASQIAFGMVTGYIIHHSKMVETMQTWPLAARAGLEARGVMYEKGGEK
ncbi:MAG: hypothetical protein L0226_13975 [Acidobacteria bacterium]|nr:hypothetical protein [Acidobacteriota bacterium]